jgi:hypothetical protein
MWSFLISPFVSLAVVFAAASPQPTPQKLT